MQMSTKSILLYYQRIAADIIVVPIGFSKLRPKSRVDFLAAEFKKRTVSPAESEIRLILALAVVCRDL